MNTVLRGAIVSLAVVGAFLGVQPVAAAADAGTDFINMLRDRYEFYIPNPQSEAYWLRGGYSICTDLMQGATAQAEADAAYRIIPYVTEKQAGNLVSAAQMTLCPQT